MYIKYIIRKIDLIALVLNSIYCFSIGMKVYIWILFTIMIRFYNGEPIPKLSTPSIPKINKIKTVKKIKRGIALGGSIGASIPILNEMLSFTNQWDTVKSKLSHKLDHTIDMSNPSQYTVDNKASGDPWSYSKLLHSILNNDIIGVSIHQDGKFAYVIESSKNSMITSHDIHRVITIPTHINELIDKLIQYDISFDVFT